MRILLRIIEDIVRIVFRIFVEEPSPKIRRIKAISYQGDAPPG
jgi:hypothetical protein